MESVMLVAFSRFFNNIFSPDAPSTSVSSSSNGDELMFCPVEGRTLCLCHHVWCIGFIPQFLNSHDDYIITVLLAYRSQCDDAERNGHT
jgi:hypothetical protein